MSSTPESRVPMRPPHYQGVRYDGQIVPDGGTAEVLERDVAALAFEGWELVETPAPAAKEDP